MRSVSYSPSAIKTLRGLPANTARLIEAKIDLYAANPAALANNVRSLKAQAGRKRLRVGDWRVIFTENLIVVAVVRVAREAPHTSDQGAVAGLRRPG